MAAAALLLEYPTLRVAFLLALAIWCFARFYYFAFYVLEHYVDPSYRFAGLGSFVLYFLRRRVSQRGEAGPSPSQAPAGTVTPNDPALRPCERDH